MFPLRRKAYLVNKLKNRSRAGETHERRSKERCRQKKPIAAEYIKSTAEAEGAVQ